MINTQLPFGAERKITFHELHSFFDAQIVIDGDQQMEVVGHHHEIVNGKDTLSMIGAQYVNEESCYAFRLEQAPPSMRSRGDEESPPVGGNFVGIRVSRGNGHLRRIVAHSGRYARTGAKAPRNFWARGGTSELVP